MSKSHPVSLVNAFHSDGSEIRHWEWVQVANDKFGAFLEISLEQPQIQGRVLHRLILVSVAKIFHKGFAQHMRAPKGSNEGQVASHGMKHASQNATSRRTSPLYLPITATQILRNMSQSLVRKKTEMSPTHSSIWPCLLCPNPQQPEGISGNILFNNADLRKKKHDVNPDQQTSFKKHIRILPKICLRDQFASFSRQFPSQHLHEDWHFGQSGQL